MQHNETVGSQGSRPKACDGWMLVPTVWVLTRSRRRAFAIGLLIMAINRILGFVLPIAMKIFFDDVVNKHQTGLLLPVVSTVILASLVQGASSLALTQLLSKSSHKMIAELRVKIQDHIGRLPLSFYDCNKTGVLISRIMNDADGIRHLVGTGLTNFIGAIMTAIIALVGLFSISAMMTLVAMSILMVFAVALTRAFKEIRQISRARPRINAEVTGRLSESLSGVRVVKGYHAEEREAKVFADGVFRLLENVCKLLTATSLSDFSAVVLTGLISAVIMFLGAHSILSHQMLLGTYVMYAMFLAMLINPVTQIVSLGPDLLEALTGLERVGEVLLERPEDDDPRRTVRMGRIEGRVAFEKVCFSYDSKKQVLDDITFQANPGTVTALIGSSGAGKSTIIGLIAAYYSPTCGRILIDGTDLSKVRLGSYRTQLGVVLQEMFLFDGTIRENVAFSRPGASDEEIFAACHIARVDEFAKTFQNGYDTIIGERGIKLSGGQRQRISIARAILANPRILILDEATSSLDTESESLIQQGLRYLLRGRTTFVIAHRLSTIRLADQILVVEGGRIIEVGTHESLSVAAGRYHDLYSKQCSAEPNLKLPKGATSAKHHSPALATTELDYFS